MIPWMAANQPYSHGLVGTKRGEHAQMSDMRRREFIVIFGGAAVAWPLAAGAQQDIAPAVGFLNALGQNDRPNLPAAFRRGLRPGQQRCTSSSST